MIASIYTDSAGGCLNEKKNLKFQSSQFLFKLISSNKIVTIPF